MKIESRWQSLTYAATPGPRSEPEPSDTIYRVKQLLPAKKSDLVPFDPMPLGPSHSPYVDLTQVSSSVYHSINQATETIQISS